MIQAFQAGQVAVPIVALTDVLARGRFMQAESLLDAAFVTVDANLLGQEGDGQTLRAAAAKRGLEQIVEEAFVSGTKAVPIPDMVFDRSNPKAVGWAKQRSAKLIVDVTEQTRAAVRRIIARAVNGTLSPREAARMIRGVIGLTDRQADAVLSLRDRLLEERKLATAIEREVSRYSAQLLRQRAETIARTETIAAANEGQRQLWEQARDRGLLAATDRRVWIATEDERTCPICGALDGKTAPIDGPFHGGFMGPPAHPNCRCATGLSFGRKS